MQDLFGDGYATCNIIDTNFRWMVALFRDRGASEAIRRANDIPLRTYYPFRTNKIGDLVPLWRSYLFIEFRDSVTMAICRSTSQFIKIISARDDEGIHHPVLVRHNAINESVKLLHQGKFDDIIFKRKFYGKGSICTIINGDFEGKRVQLLCDISSDMKGDRMVPVLLGGWKARIEVNKLGL
jgi:hypothetical protein